MNIQRLLASLTLSESSLENLMRRPAPLMSQGQWLGLLFIAISGLITYKIARVYLTGVVRRIYNRAHVTYRPELERRIAWPITLLVFSGVWEMVVPFLDFPKRTEKFLMMAGGVVFAMGAFIALLHLVDLVGEFYERKMAEGHGLGELVAPLAHKAGKFFVCGLGVVFIGDALGLDMKGLVAGLGIGGLAFALAAKDTLANVLASFTVVADSPFNIGDWVKIGNDLEGSVESVGLRSTRIRTLRNTLVTVPNGQLVNLNIDNFGARHYFVTRVTIGLEYGTSPERIEAFCEGVRQIILNTANANKQNFLVYLNGMGASSLDVLVHVCFDVESATLDLKEKHTFFLAVLKLAKNLGVNIAFPSQTVYQRDEGPQELPSVPGNFYEWGRNEGRKIALGMDRPR